MATQSTPNIPETTDSAALPAPQAQPQAEAKRPATRDPLPPGVILTSLKILLFVMMGGRHLLTASLLKSF